MDKKEEFCPIKDKSLFELQNAISKSISDLTKSEYVCIIDNMEFMDWNKITIKLTLDGANAAIMDIAER
ncbi:MAG: hypothetical protein K8F60_01045 [Melioribacteraceae bacterium]|jgi:hypothetical protein|nr:hypothetical protein [Melioribacteraceae bacterium]